ncbi:MAG: DUF3750 domain-containing protein [Patescibacteria group bacterium]|jgi:hypothetical protein
MADSKKFDELIDNEKYQVFLFTSSGNIPFHFAAHPWFVINNRGLISRWEVLFRKMYHETNGGHLYKNFFPLFQGIEVVHFSRKSVWKAKLLGSIEGDTAKKMVSFIENSYSTYPFRDRYFLTGPNSNTYPQWVLDHFPEFAVKLPWNAFGKNYARMVK